MRKVSKTEAEAKAREWGCHYIEASAKTRYNIDEIYYDIMRKIAAEKLASAEHQVPKRTNRKSNGCILL